MPSFPDPSRRSVLASAGGLTLGSALLSGAVQPASANTALAAVRHSTFQLGAFEVTTLLDASRTVTDPQTIFAMNVTPEEFASVSAANFIPSDQTRFFFTPTLVKTETDVVLFDTGSGGDDGQLVEVMAEAGYAPDDVTIVVVTHMHPDHIGGLMQAGAPTFPSAAYVTGSAEYNFFTSDNAPERLAGMVSNMVVPLAERMTFLDDGGSVTGGITAVAAFGHTPGHMTYRIESQGQQLHLIIDLANHYVWSLAYPDWEVRFDADKAAAATVRRNILGMIAADKIPFIGYHMPFPSVGFIEANGDGFRYVPETYQFSL
ncbi:MAG: MBL fold metallo-hydrolase [Pseudomonadota bacterium]